eukprot:5710933-Alexandrium_andersonii.AAC.1
MVQGPACCHAVGPAFIVEHVPAHQPAAHLSGREWLEAQRAAHRARAQPGEWPRRAPAMPRASCPAPRLGPPGGFPNAGAAARPRDPAGCARPAC